MKKYLFLLSLFFIYLILYFKNDTKQAISYNYIDNSTVSITVNFNTGINSKELVDSLSKYNKEYLIDYIEIDNYKYNIKCNDINICIDKIFSMNKGDFYQKYIATGFKINRISIISDYNYLISFLNTNEYLYELN